MRYWWTSLVVIVGIVGTAPALAAGCEEALDRAARRHGVPAELMLAIGQVESGWHPFAINSAGSPHFADSAAAAVAFVRAEQARGVALIDVGCGQINLHWHGDSFADLLDAFDPWRNADYAARFLAALHARHGTWTAAAAHYHSSQPAVQQVYVEKVRQRLAALNGGTTPLYFATRLAVIHQGGVTVYLPSRSAANGAASRAAGEDAGPRILTVGSSRRGSGAVVVRGMAEDR